MKYLKGVILLVLLLSLLFALGPRKSYEPTDNNSIDLGLSIDSVEDYLRERESKFPIRKDNESRVIWAHAPGEKTDYVLLYMHGFSASQEEGDPLHEEIAEKYGMNLYLTRLQDHGLDVDKPMEDLTPKGLLNSAKEAISIAKTLGDSLIIMSCSTGSTLAAILDPQEPLIAAHIMYSPNIDIYDPLSNLVTLPWGKQIMELNLGGDENILTYEGAQNDYWYQHYHINSIIALKQLINDWMNEELFKQIDTPVFLGYYYKDDELQDKVVSVERMHEFYDQLGTSSAKKQKVAFPEAGAHVICSDLFSNSVDDVRKATITFMDEVLHIPKRVKQVRVVSQADAQ